MARCASCNAFKLFLGSNQLCKSCEELVLLQNERENRERRERERNRRLEQEARERRLYRERLAEEERQLAEWKKPNTPPAVTNGFALVYSYYDVGFYSPDDLRSIAIKVPPHKQLTLVREPENEHDSEAIAIYYEESKIGYMNKGQLRDMLNDYAASDQKEFLIISRYWLEKPTFDLFFYQSVELLLDNLKANPAHKVFTLVGNKNVEMQDALSCTSAGEKVTIEYDMDKDKYLVTCITDIGYLSKSASAYMEEIGNYSARVLECFTNDNGDYSAKIIVAPK